MIFYYNSRDIKYKKPFGSVASESEVRFRIEAKDGIYVNNIKLVLTLDGGEDVYYTMDFVEKKKHISVFEVKFKIDNAGLYWYRFVADTEVGELHFGKNEKGELSKSGESFQLTVYDKNYVTPQNQKGGVIYHIFVDRFKKGDDPACVWKKSGVLKKWDEEVTIVDPDGVFRANDFYGGNLQGIIDELDYLQELGVTMLYLSPIFKSSSNHRYDTGDYMTIDELLGDEDSFIRLVERAKEKGIGIMLDGVFNHTGSDSLYFNKFRTYDSFGAYQGIKSPYYDWYTFINYPDEYACWWGITVTPTVNKHNESYKRFIFGDGGVLDKWTKLGIEGWRLDVVDELDIDFVNSIRERVKKVNDKAYVIGEVWEDASNKIAYSQRRPYFLGKQLDGVMNYPFKEAILKYVRNKDNNTFINNIMSIYENYPLQSLNCCMNFLGTHDTVRAINSLSDHHIHGTSKHDRLKAKLSISERALAKARLKLASVLQYALPGIPSVYYGDEIGLEGYEDPINRKPFPWDKMDLELLNHYKMLGGLRRDYKDIFAGEMEIMQKDGVLYITRHNNGKSIHFIINNSHTDKTILIKNKRNCITKEKIDGETTIKEGDFIIIR